MITKIKLNNFKAFQEAEFDIAPLTLITGINGMGKSTVIQSLLLLKQSYEIEYLQTQRKVDLSNDYINLETAENLCYAMSGDDDKKVGVAITMSNADTHKWEIDASKPSEKILGCNYWGNNHIETLALFSKDFIFLDAERWGPRETYYKKEKRSYNTKLGIQGELTPAYIVNAISYNEQIGVNELKHPSLIKSTELYENLNAWMSDIMNLPLKAKVAELDESRIQLSYNIEGGKGTSYSALQVGFGLTFCLPIVVAVLCAKKGDLIIVENPEAHLHPAAQSRLGGLLAMVAKYGVQVIIETHSEHIINGVRLAVLKKAIEPNEVVINFFSTNIDGGIFKPSHGNIRIQQDGELTEWPVHFFDQAELDFIELLRLKAGK